ncbi:MAG: hypothetical protein LVO36_03115 [Nitrosopumilus sp. (ex Thoosa mismalolli)]|nr:hypothetical protein [Nitrosopumilus sp. (ex Thoosa mismalolli)]
MSQSQIKSWVLVSSIKKDVAPEALQGISPQVSSLVDEWHSKGRIMLSGPFDNAVSSMAVFEATKEEAKDFFKKYENICSGILTYEMYQWNVPPVLSILS